jgi:molybdopterin-containing oxidoreductase family iron-sulfur binding subunit
MRSTYEEGMPNPTAQTVISTITVPVIPDPNSPDVAVRSRAENAYPALEEKLSSVNATSGKQYWRSLEELADTPEFEDYLHREFPEQASEWYDPVTRRNFMKVMGASFALMGLNACTRQPREEIVPYVQQPESLVPNRPLYYATSMPMHGVGLGLLVRSNEGRPTKIEGNPLHPSSLGGTDVFSQASVLGLYDPDRSRTVSYLGEIRSWSGFVTELKSQVAAQGSKNGAGLRILTENITSPTLANQILQILAKYPQAKWHQYEPAFKSGAVAAGGGNAVYHFDKADRVLSLDADFLGCGAESVRYSKDFSKTRKVEDTGNKMSRLYVVECTPTITGATADHRLPAKPSEIDTITRAIAQGLGVANANAGNLKADHAKFVNAVVADLKENAGRSIVVAGDYQPWHIHAMAAAMNQALGNVGTTVTMTAPLYAYPVDNNASLADLVKDLNAGTVDTLLIMGANPVYSAPADLNFKEAIKKAKWRAHHGLYRDETAEYCQWHVPATHYLETWGDIKAHDGSVSLIQPLIAPLYNNKSEYEFIGAFAENPNETGYNIVRGFWQSKISGNFEQAWRKAVHDGVLAGVTLPATSTPAAVSTAQLPAPQAAVEGIELVFRPDPAIHDGRYANNGWLQELPKPLTKLTWDNAVLISPNTAKRLGLGNQMGAKGGNYGADVIEITYQDRKLNAPIWIMPGQPDDVLTLHMGYGRHRAGRVAEGAGFNANLIRTIGSPFSGSGVQVRKTGDSVQLAVTQTHSNMEGRDIVRSASLADYIKNQNVHKEGTHEFAKEISLYPEYDYSKGHKWGMAIDLNSCTGCSACVVACVSENNIPVVGREQVQRSREMQWIRIDRYFTGEVENPETVFQPLLCQQCEKAPCEVVCPVGATVHSAEGLNDMVYNRCIGTRYCSHNCPYKVRRFNFLLFQDFTTPEMKMVRNPEVTVRSRGVMEKCTYCVQRIQNGKYEAEKENRPLRDGEIQSACQSACPADAITFGDLNDKNSRVSKLKSDPRNYALLAELNTQPRTTYLAALKNVNPELAAAPAHADAHGGH